MLSRTVEVQIDVVDRSNKPPVWDQTIYGPIYVKENTAVGETVTTVKARSVGSSFKILEVFAVRFGCKKDRESHSFKAEETDFKNPHNF